MDPAIALAEQQAGVVSRAQLLEKGLSAPCIDHRLESGRYRQLLRGVYAVGHRALAPTGWWQASLLSVGEDAAISHQAAAMVNGDLAIPPGASTGPHGEPLLPLHVTVPRHVACRPGLTVHQTRHLDHRDVWFVRNLRTTSATRTLIDLADVLPYRELRDIADGMRRLDAAWLRRSHARLPGRRGAASIDELLVSIEGGWSRSWLERRLAPFLRDGGFPQPDRRNEWVAGFRVDAIFDGPRLLIELDSRSWHQRQLDMRVDRRRDRAYAAAGWTCARLMPEELRADHREDTWDELAKLGLPRVG